MFVVSVVYDCQNLFVMRHKFAKVPLCGRSIFDLFEQSIVESISLLYLLIDGKNFGRNLVSEAYCAVALVLI